MKHIQILVLPLLLFSCGQKNSNDSVDDYDRLDLANTVDTTKGTYNPRVDSTIFFQLTAVTLSRLQTIQTIGSKRQSFLLGTNT